MPSGNTILEEAVTGPLTPILLATGCLGFKSGSLLVPSEPVM